MGKLTLYSHPFSSYCQKSLIALYENGTPFTYRHIAEDAGAMADLVHLWPFAKFPVLIDGDARVAESSIIVEYLDLHYPGSIRMVPADPKAALDVRMLDRIFDNYVMTPMTKIVGDAMRADDAKDPAGIADARRLLDKSYAWLDTHLEGRLWAAGEQFTLADCAAAPSLFYADWVHPVDESHANLRAYRARLLARPSFARAVDEARPYRPFFPPGAPDRD